MMEPAALAQASRRIHPPLSRGTAGWRRGITAISSWRPLQPQGRLRNSIHLAELDGLRFALRARCGAVAVVMIWLLTSIAWPRNIYYAGIALVFLLLGYLPYRLRHHRFGDWIKLGFVMLDVALVATVILMPPPAGLRVDWPVQMRLRGQEFLFLLLLLAEAALTYAPVIVLWTGSMIMTMWSIGVRIIYDLPTSIRLEGAPSSRPLTTDDALRALLHPDFVGLTPLYTQLIATGLFTVILAAAVWRGRLMMLARVQSEVVRSDLARYVSPDVADALATQVQSGFGEPVTREVAVLFADVVGFTGLSEHLSPERTFALLRSFHDRSCRKVFEHGGTLDKYLGDGFMATFGGVVDQDDAAERALACAFGLQSEMALWNAKRLQRGADPIDIAIGIHCGAVVVGNLGAERRIEFTVVGDVVNVASRLQQATREFDSWIAASAVCVEAAGASVWAARFTRTEHVQLRGRSQGVAVHLG